jgi:ATPase subunit of ABC transporter with duplicated ATPase domains
MIELGINNLAKYYGVNKIFENINFEIKTGERVGLIGQNGCGKTTLFKMIMELEESNEGEINIRKDAKVGYLNQIPVFEDNITVNEVIQMAFDTIFDLKQQMEKLEKTFSELEGKELEKALNQYGVVCGKFELEGGYDLETRISKITKGLEIDEVLKNMHYDSLSGGEKTRVILAKILLEEPDILLLDEPTNHLDLETIKWLEEFLKVYKGSVVIISHDRYFLDSVVGKIVELEQNKVNTYNGNYSYYVVEKERRFLIEYKHYLNQQKKIDQMERQIQRYRIWGEMRDSEAMFKRAKELEKRLEKIEVMDKPVLDKRKVKFKQEMADRSGKIVVDLQGISKGYGTNDLLNEIDFTLFYQDSACIIGSNGCGKTTMLKMILDEIQPDTGILKMGAGVSIGYLPQQVYFPDEEQTILDYFTFHHNITYEIARGALARVLFFKEDVNRKIKFLSGGEKSRLKLCSLTFEKVNLLILDEPTNHLDIDSRENLEQMLIDYEGTILFVSHDRYFINKVADKIIEIEEKKLKVYTGDYNYYLEEYEKYQLKQETLAASSPVNKPKVKENKTTEKVRIGNNNINGRKLELIEFDIEKMENRLKVLEEELIIHSQNYEKLNLIYKEKEDINHSLLKAYSQWEDLQQV